MSGKKNTKSKKVVVPFDQRSLLFKVSEKKAISIYGLNRFPVTLYKDQMLRLLDSSDQIRKFIEDHNDELASKKESKEEEVETVTFSKNEIEMEIKPF
jgi:hypothetical protein